MWQAIYQAFNNFWNPTPELRAAMALPFRERIKQLGEWSYWRANFRWPVIWRRLVVMYRDIASRADHYAPPTSQTFGIENCVDLFWKLDWEIAGLRLRAPHDVIDMKYFAFNAAVTAWALTDWVFEDMTSAQRDRHRVRSRSEFQKLARDQCRALHLCRQVATASKHRTVDKYPDPGVSAGVNIRPVPQTEGRVGTWEPLADWEIVITDGATTRLAVDVLEEARSFWYRFIPKLGLIID